MPLPAPFPVDINHAPQGTSTTITLNENGSYTLQEANFGFSDPNDSPPNGLLAVEITTTPTAGTLVDTEGGNTTPVTAGEFISKADIDAGDLVFTPAANGLGDDYASLTFQVEDDGGTANGGQDLDPNPKTMTFDVDSTEKMYFSAVNTGSMGPDLFELPEDSTPQAIPVRTDPNAIYGSYAGEDGGFHALGGNLYFLANTAGTFDAVFQLSTTGTLTELSGATGISEQNANFTYFDNSLYFAGETSDDGAELIRLDANGTLTTIDVNPGAANSFAGQTGFAVFDGSLYFSADTTATGLDLFKLAAGSTTPVAVEVDPGSQDSDAGEDGGFFVFDNTLYFNANDSTGNEALFSLAAGSSTPVEVKDANDNAIGHTSEIPSSFHQFDGQLYFDAVDPGTLEDTLVTIGANGVAAPILYQGQDLQGAGQFGGFTEFDGDLYFTATTATTNTDLFKIDSAGTVTDLNLTNSGAFGAFDANLVSGFEVFNGSLYFDAYNAGGDALYALAAGSTTPTIVLNSGTTLAGVAGGFQIFDGDLYFSAYTSAGYELVQIAPDGTQTVYDINQGPSNNSTPGQYGGFVVFPGALTLTNVAVTVIFVDNQTVAVSPSLSVTDSGNLDLVSATVAITGGAFAGDGDVLSANTAGTSITASYNSSTETLTLTGADTLANYQNVLDAVTFSDPILTPDNDGADPTRQITWTVDDGGLSTTATTTVDVKVNQAPTDFYGNGVSQVLFRDNSTGDTGFYQVSNGAYVGWQDVGVSSTAYSVVGTGDFFGNGTSDILFRDNSTGDTGFYAINNGTYAGWQDIGGSSTAYSVVGVGDFLGNGTDDILFRDNSTGDTGFYEMSNGVNAGWQDVGGSSTAYSVVGVGDFLGNGTDDILFRDNTNGDTGFYQMSNGVNVGWVDLGGSSTAYSVVGTGDFLGNGTDDILFRNETTGDIGFYQMSNGTNAGWHDIGGSNTTYAVVGTGDYMGNGTDDILFRNDTTGDTGFYAIVSGANTGWHVTASSTAYQVVG